jgi:hypothetical protein
VIDSHGDGRMGAQGMRPSKAGGPGGCVVLERV